MDQAKQQYKYYEDKYDFSLTKSGCKSKSGKKKNKKKNSISCYNSKHIRVKMNKANKKKHK